jgi:hypothetical protein
MVYDAFGAEIQVLRRTAGRRGFCRGCFPRRDAGYATIPDKPMGGKSEFFGFTVTRMANR